MMDVIDDDASELNQRSLSTLATGYRGTCRLQCIFCHHCCVELTMKLLPCLHVVCSVCLENYLLSVSSTLSGESRQPLISSEAIFSCPKCRIKIQLPKSGISGLKTASFMSGVNCWCSHLNTDDVHGSTFCSSKPGKDRKADSMLCSAVVQPAIETYRESTYNSHEGTGNGDESKINDQISESNAQLLLCNSMTKLDKCDNDITAHYEFQENVDVTQKSVSSAVNNDSNENSLYCGVTSVMADTSPIQLVSTVKSDACHTLGHLEKVFSHTDVTRQHLNESRSSLREKVQHHAEYLCRMIQSKRDHLLNVIDRQYIEFDKQCLQTSKQLQLSAEGLHQCIAVCDAISNSEEKRSNSCDSVCDELKARVSQLSSCVSSHKFSAIPQLRLDLPDKSRDEWSMDKLFGVLVRGTVGNCKQMLSFHTELHWPSAFVMLRSRDSVLVGKTGAFADSGRIIFYNRQRICVDSKVVDATKLPVDAVATTDGSVLVSYSNGSISVFSSAGQVIADWPNMFRGASGKMAVENGGSSVKTFIITSVQDRSIIRYELCTGRVCSTFELIWPDKGASLEPNAVSVTVSGEIVVAVLNDLYIYVYDQNGLAQRKFFGYFDQQHQHLSSSYLPSALCCDSFNNVLIADFIGNCVHVVSCGGRYLGRLLTERDGISCPNCVSVDQDGCLHIGQYGGEILVYQYLSFIKHA